ncbi:MAG: site-specific integrase [Verrucomicrobia bacterium]|nr:site-specific integrase [Verrucomicrobiota bacterium]MCG2678748.1 site-specific integrase [Kiritimatiellia bacterium]
MTERQQTLQFLTQTELKCLLDKAKTESPRDYAMVLLAYRHGLRATEVCNITVENVDLDAKNIRCERGKGSISNWQLLAEDEIKAIKTWMKKRPKSESNYVFTSRKGSPVSRSQFFRVFQHLAEETGLAPEKRHPHTLKHSLATHLSSAGLPPQIIQNRLGHRSIQSTMVYVAVSSGFVDRMVSSALASGNVV